MDDANFEILLNRVAMIIDPEAFECRDNLTPTERDIWNDARGRRQGDAGEKARNILDIFFAVEQSEKPHCVHGIADYDLCKVCNPEKGSF